MQMDEICKGCDYLEECKGANYYCTAYYVADELRVKIENAREALE